MRRRAPLLPLIALLALAGCDQSMQDQPSIKPYEATAMWPDGTPERGLPDGVVTRGASAALAALSEPPPVSEALLARGRRDFDDFCAPCHGYAGDGDGIVVQRGFPPPPSYHSDRLRAAPASHFVDVITNGYGAMYAYSDRVAPEDRWAITAYIRALQTSRDTALAAVPDAAEALQ
ncbi:c-type cytochrome [Mangrovibrevibacter kandeliae]|uniref:c-type cytochrome n=1 Tax=Mangrovibrevibacter kandeliae TaxID=2968473 RepID=UPI002117DA91|nr:cytochrome c [Aurantimonas sp. CSK15Z-1]MCQ8783994.1 cytochrome c [Aurantimonas sp. CSK15Z-1]